MDNDTANIAAPANTTARRRSDIRVITVCALTVTAANLTLWSVGRVAGASFLVDPALTDGTVRVGALKVAATTLLPLAVGMLLVTLAARRSRRWVIGTGLLGAVVALASAAGPLDGGQDTATGLALATMHLTTGAGFVVAVPRFRGRRPVWHRGTPGQPPRRPTPAPGA